MQERPGLRGRLRHHEHHDDVEERGGDRAVLSRRLCLKPRGAVAIMGRYQLGRQLTSVEIERLVAFLKTLTGEYEGSVLQ